jgi:hypothetical protein
VKNTLLTAQHPDFGFYPWPANYVASVLCPPYTNSSASLSGAWTPSDFVYAMIDANVIFYSGHGTPLNFYAGKTWTDSQTEFVTTIAPSGADLAITGHFDWLGQVGVEPYRSTQMGSGLPPFNSTATPPINLAFLLCCGSGSNQDFIRFCLPYANAYNNWLEDQAVIGFIPSIFVNEEQNIAMVAFDVLASGKTVRRAKDAIVAAGYRRHVDPPAVSPPLIAEDIAIYGDLNTRIKSVYTGDSALPAEWCR